MIYKVWVCLEAEYDDIEADSEEEAFLIASDAAMSGGSWEWRAERSEEDTDESVIAEWICLGHRSGYLKHPYSIDYKCSNCGHEEYTLLSPPPEICPNCRAHMKGEQDERSNKKTGVD